MTKINSYSDLLEEKKRLEVQIKGRRQQFGQDVNAIKSKVILPKGNNVLGKLAEQFTSKSSQSLLAEVGTGIALSWASKLIKKKGISAAKRYALPVAGGVLAIYLINKVLKRKKTDNGEYDEDIFE